MPGVSQPPLIREDDPKATFLITQYMQDLNRMARNLTFLDSNGAKGDGRRCLNIDAVWLHYVSNGTANTEDTLTHTLGRTPLEMWVGMPDKAATIYRGSGTWSSTQVFLRATATTVTVDLLLF